jgi:hypothetical protein
MDAQSVVQQASQGTIERRRHFLPVDGEQRLALANEAPMRKYALRRPVAPAGQIDGVSIHSGDAPVRAGAPLLQTRFRGWCPRSR